MVADAHTHTDLLLCLPGTGAGSAEGFAVMAVAPPSSTPGGLQQRADYLKSFSPCPCEQIVLIVAS